MQAEIVKDSYGKGTYTDILGFNNTVTVANQICMAIVLDTVDLSTQQYEYTLRYNNSLAR